MSNLAGQRIKDTYDGVLHASGSSLTLGNGNSTDTIDANFNAVYVPVGGLKEDGASHTSVSATTSVAGHVELATDAEAHAATDTTRAVTPSNLLIKKDAGGAIIAGALDGDSRGGGALDVQSYRNYSSQVASGASSSAVGYDNRAFGAGSSSFGYYNNASGTYSSAFGNNNTASGYYSSAIGYRNEASGGLYSSGFGCYSDASQSYSSAFGYRNLASGERSSAIGYYNRASGTSSSAFGHYTKTTVNNTFEAGYWSNGSTRGGAIRIHPNGQVAMTMVDSASAPTDGGATAGSEADGKLARGMFAIQKNGSFVTLYYNNGGTIQSLGLGTLS